MMRTTPLLAAVASLAARRRLLNRIKAEAKEQGLTSGQLAEKAGVRPESLSRAAGRKDIGFDTLWRLAAALGYGIDLVPHAGEPEDDIDISQFPGFKG